MIDFESALKKAWKACPCQLEIEICGYAQPVLGNIMCDCNIRGSQTSKPIKCANPLHAALLEMVDKIHLPNCLCRRPGGGAGCHIERRRLRAAVGVDK